MLGLGLSFTHAARHHRPSPRTPRRTAATPPPPPARSPVRLTAPRTPTSTSRSGAAPDQTAYDCRPYGRQLQRGVQGHRRRRRHRSTAGHRLRRLLEVRRSQVGAPDGAANYSYNTNAGALLLRRDGRPLHQRGGARATSHVPTLASYIRTDHYSVSSSRPTPTARSSAVSGWATRRVAPRLRVVAERQAALQPGRPDLRPCSSRSSRTRRRRRPAAAAAPAPTTQNLAKDLAVGATSKYFTVGVPAGKKLTVKMSGTGNADLFVRLGSRPTINVFTAKSTGAASTRA